MLTSLGEPGHEASLGFGSNLGDSIDILQSAWMRLRQHPAILPVAFSSFYRTSPQGMKSSRWFVNAAALIRTTLTPHALLQELQGIEAFYGRIRSRGEAGYQDRTLDIDLLLYGNCILRSDDLVVPHPRIAQRLFVLEPLAEIAGDRIEPQSGQRVEELWQYLRKNDTNQVVEQVVMSW